MEVPKLDPSKRYLAMEQVIGNPRKGVPGKFPCTKFAWFKGVALGRFPQPIVFSHDVFVWEAEEIDALVQRETESPGTLVWLFKNQKEQA